jgi:hypothetical protein
MTAARATTGFIDPITSNDEREWGLIVFSYCRMAYKEEFIMNLNGSSLVCRANLQG